VGEDVQSGTSTRRPFTVRTTRVGSAHEAVGAAVDLGVGDRVVGLLVGIAVGLCVGLCVGALLGRSVGDGVGRLAPHSPSRFPMLGSAAFSQWCSASFHLHHECCLHFPGHA